MDESEKLAREWNLLTNYKKYGIPTRDNLIKIAFQNLEDLESNSGQFENTPEPEKNILRTSLQLDILAKIITLLEDLFVIAESFRQGRNFYELLDEDDPDKEIGALIKKFLDDLPSFSDAEISKIMGFVDPDQTKLDETCKAFLKNHFKKNVDQLRIRLFQLGEFSKNHHIIFKRFKHAGMPILFDISLNPASDVPDDLFDSWFMVSKGPDPMQDALPFPYSKDVIEGYKLVIHGVSKILEQMILVKLENLMRNTEGVIPINAFYKMTPEEIKKLKQKSEQFAKDNPVNPRPNLDFTVTNEDESHLLWYLNLPKYLKMNKAKNEDVVNYRKSMGNNFS